MTVSFPLKSAGEKLLESDVQGLRLDLLNAGGDFQTSTGSADTYVLALDAQIVALAGGMAIPFIVNHTNEDAATLNVNAIGAIDIINIDGSALSHSQLLSGMLAVVYYDGTDFILMNPNKTGREKFGGDGSDGSLDVTTDTTLNPTYQVFNYTDFTIDAGQTLDFGSNFQNKLIYIRVQNDVIINGTLSLKGAGSVGGAGGNPGSNGTDGGAVHVDCLDVLTHEGGNGENSAGGGNGTAGAALTKNTGITSLYLTPQTKRVYYLLPGVGGGGGAGGNATGGSAVGGTAGSISALPTNGGDGENFSGGGKGAGGAGGGAGGGMLIIECGGDFTIGASGIIDLSGQDGANGGDGGDAITSGHGGSGGGGGGGGTGGMGIMLYNGTLSNSGTIDVSGGDGGTGGGRGTGISGASSTNAGGGGGGGGFWSGAGGAGGGTADTGTAGSAGSGGGGGGGSKGSATGSNSGGAGGTGNASSGSYVLEKNTTFA